MLCSGASVRQIVKACKVGVGRVYRIRDVMADEILAAASPPPQVTAAPAPDEPVDAIEVPAVIPAGEYMVFPLQKAPQQQVSVEFEDRVVIKGHQELVVWMATQNVYNCGIYLQKTFANPDSKAGDLSRANGMLAKAIGAYASIIKIFPQAGKRITMILDPYGLRGIDDSNA